MNQDLLKADQLQHGFHHGRIRTAPVTCVMTQLVARIESHRRPEAIEHVDVGFQDQELARDTGHFLQGHVVFGEHLHNLGIEGGSRLFLNHLHGLVERQGAAVLAVGSQGVEAIHGSKDTRSEGDVFTRKSGGVSGAVRAAEQRIF